MRDWTKQPTGEPAFGNPIAFDLAARPYRCQRFLLGFFHTPIHMYTDALYTSPVSPLNSAKASPSNCPPCSSNASPNTNSLDRSPDRPSQGENVGLLVALQPTSQPDRQSEAPR